MPFSAAILMALFGLCAFGAFLFVTTLYLQDVRGRPALLAGLCLLPVGVMIVVLSPLTGRLVGRRGPRLPLAVSGAALALGGGASVWLGPVTPLPALLATYLLFGVALGTVNPPITNSAVSGMPGSMAGVAASLASAGRQTGTALGVAISGTIVAPALAHGATAFTGRLVGARGPRVPLLVAGGALALGGGASLWLGPATPLPAMLAVYVLFGVFLGTVNPPITNTAVSGMPRSMAGVATSLASAGRQTGTTLGVAISGTIVGSALARGGTAFTSAEHAVWWLVLGLGAGIGVLGLLSTGRWASATARRAAALFEEVDRGAGPRAVSPDS